LEADRDPQQLGETVFRSFDLAPDLGRSDGFALLLKRLGLRSRKAFEREVRAVHVIVKGPTLTVSPMVAFDRGGMGGLKGHKRKMTYDGLTEAELGQAILDAYDAIKDHPPLPKS
jgi:hypothetical protein